jgi:hypothetical protein
LRKRLEGYHKQQKQIHQKDVAVEEHNAPNYTTEKEKRNQLLILLFK